MEAYLPLFLILIAIIAFLYSSVGHGGASGYLAVMALLGVAPALMKPTGLTMNVAVSLISFIGFYKAGHFRFNLFIPFAISSVPMAFLGGMMTLPDSMYKKVLAICLLVAVLRMVVKTQAADSPSQAIPLWAGLISGGLIGLLSGMIGIGGGIILTPLMLLMRWASLKETAAVSALFIFVNSISGLYGQWQSGGLQLPNYLLAAVGVAIVGGTLGSYFGSQKFSHITLRNVLALGLAIASMKLMFT